MKAEVGNKPASPKSRVFLFFILVSLSDFADALKEHRNGSF